jgi:DNA-binding response OmpR family regulator
MLLTTPSTTSPGQSLNKAACLSVVVVEARDDVRDKVVEVIEKHGHHVVGLGCAEEMDDAVGILQIDLLIVDLNLPGENGFSLARRFRVSQPLAGIIIYSENHSVADKVKSYDSGADIFLQKPVSSEELMASIKSIARRLLNQGPIADPVKPKKFFIELEKLLLTGPLGQVSLTDTEGLLLSSLARAPSQRLEISQLLAILKLDTRSYSKAAFEVRMVRLRKKLMSVGATKLCIRSIRLHGYQLGTALQVY